MGPHMLTANRITGLKAAQRSVTHRAHTSTLSKTSKMSVTFLGKFFCYFFGKIFQIEDFSESPKMSLLEVGNPKCQSDGSSLIYLPCGKKRPVAEVKRGLIAEKRGERTL